MNEALTRRLNACAPLLYRRAQGPALHGPFGFACGAGWYPLLERMSQRLEAHLHSLLDLGVPLEALPRAVQVKQKFGGLRVYLSATTEETGRIVALACEEAERTCEQCGASGALVRDFAYVRTLCEACAQQQREQERCAAEEDDEDWDTGGWVP